MATFDENGNYVKTTWKGGDKITAAKLNKIEESLEAINNNDISRHVEADARLDKLESGAVSDKQEINAKVDALEDVVEANKDAADLEIYSINAHMTLLDKKIDDGVAEVEVIANTVDGKIAAAETNMEAMVAEVEADLEGLHAKDEYIENQISNRVYKPKFIVSTYWNEVTGINGSYMMYDESKILNDLDNWVYHKVDGITIIIHIGVNLPSNKLFIGADLETLIRYANLAKQKGLEIHAVKIHKQGFDQSHIEVISDFNIQYKILIDTIANRFIGITDRIICFNEFNHMYGNQVNKAFVINTIIDTQAKGYRVGISTQGSEELYIMDDDIKNVLDILGINHYRYISTKKDKTTYTDGFNAWNQSTVLKTMKHLKEKYPDKEIVMTESGVQDYWDALSKPENFTWADMTLTDGKAQAIYLYGLLSNTNVDYIDSVWWWYNFSTKISETSNITRCMLGGYKYE